MPYLKEHVPELLERQRARSQKQKSNFRFLGLHRIIVQDLINDNPRLNLRISQFAGMSSWRQFKSTTTATMGGKDGARRRARRGVNIGSNQKHTHYGKQNNNPSRPPQLWPASWSNHDQKIPYELRPCTFLLHLSSRYLTSFPIHPPSINTPSLIYSNSTTLFSLPLHTPK